MWNLIYDDAFMMMRPSNPKIPPKVSSAAVTTMNHSKSSMGFDTPRDNQLNLKRLSKGNEALPLIIKTNMNAEQVEANHFKFVYEPKPPDHIQPQRMLGEEHVLNSMEEMTDVPVQHEVDMATARQ